MNIENDQVHQPVTNGLPNEDDLRHPQEVFCIASFEQHLLENNLQMLNDELQEYIPSYLTVILG